MVLGPLLWEFDYLNDRDPGFRTMKDNRTQCTALRPEDVEGVEAFAVGLEC